MSAAARMVLFIINLDAPSRASACCAECSRDMACASLVLVGDGHRSGRRVNVQVNLTRRSILMSTRSQPTPGATAFHEFTRAMWTEFKIAADYATGMTEATRGTLHAPGGFVENELGFGLESPDKCGPGCRCTALRSQCARGTGSRRPRTGREWQKLVSRASAAAHAA